jgi:hypothetical protein
LEALPAALFLVPGAFAVVGHRFVSAQRFASGTQLLMAVAYSAAAYVVLASPIGAGLTTPEFPSQLFSTNSAPLAEPSIAVRLLVLALISAGAGMVIGRLSSSRAVHDLSSLLTGRNLYSSVWTEAFRGAPRQWVRLHAHAKPDLIGVLESVSEDESERGLLLSRVHEVDGSKLRRVVGNRSYVNAAGFDAIVLLGRDVATAIEQAAGKLAER